MTIRTHRLPLLQPPPLLLWCTLLLALGYTTAIGDYTERDGGMCWHIPASATEGVDARGRVCDPYSMVLDDDDEDAHIIPGYIEDQYQAGCCPTTGNSMQYPPVEKGSSKCFPTLPTCVSSCIATSRVSVGSTSDTVHRSVKRLGIFHGCVVACRHGPRSTVHQHEYRSPSHHCFR